jgi:hypothetical protein
VIKRCAEFIFEHISRKGYDRVITHAKPIYARMWQRMLGFKPASGKEPVLFEGHDEPYIELVKDLSPPQNAITPETDATVLFRIEGYWADSNGRRNMDSVDLPQPFVKRLCRRFPAQRLSRPCVEGGRHGSNLLGAVRTQISAFREVLTQQSVGVLVGTTLPEAMRIAEVDLDARINLETGMLSHLGTLIPGQ